MRFSTTYWAIGALVSVAAALFEDQALQPRNGTGAPSEDDYDIECETCCPPPVTVGVTVTEKATCEWDYPAPTKTVTCFETETLSCTKDDHPAPPPTTVYSTIYQETTIFTTAVDHTTVLEYTTEFVVTTTTKTYETSYPVTVTTVTNCGPEETEPPVYETGYRRNAAPKPTGGAILGRGSPPVNVCETITTTEWATTTTTECITVTEPTTTTRTILVPTTVPTTVEATETVVRPTTIEETETVVRPTTIEETETVVRPTTIKETNTVVQPTTIEQTETVVSPTTIWQPTTYTSTTTFVTEYTITITSDHTVVTTSVTTSVETTVATLTTSYPVVTTVPVTRTAIVTAPGDTVTAPGATVTAPGEIITAPGETVTAPGVTVTVTSRFQVTLCPMPTGIGNATHSPQSNLILGCEPGYVCDPPKPEGCNFYPDVPDNDFLCAPEHCIEAPPYTTVDWKGAEPSYYPPSPGYFNLNPNAFGLSYDIFEYEVIEVVKHGHTKLVTTGNWESQATLTTWPDAPPASTTIARSTRGLHDRRSLSNLNERAEAPAFCYDWCDNARGIIGHDGKGPETCEDGSDFFNAYTLCRDCIVQRTDATKDTIRDYVQPKFQDFIDFCETSDTSPTASASTTADPAETGDPTIETSTQESTRSESFSQIPASTTTTTTVSPEPTTSTEAESSITSTTAAETTTTAETTAETSTETTISEATTTSAVEETTSTVEQTTSTVEQTTSTSETESTTIAEPTTTAPGPSSTVSITAPITTTTSGPVVVPTPSGPSTVPPSDAHRVAMGTTIMISILTMLAAFFG